MTVFMTQFRKIQFHYHQHMVIIRETMSANYFDKIRKFIHFVDNTDLTDEGNFIEKLKKIKSILSELKKN